jgi:methionine biosynthesis protein MetW
VPLYAELSDRLFSAPGVWQMKRCPQAGCGLLWLDPAPAEEDLGEVYRDYYTHGEAPSGTGWMRTAYSSLQRAYWSFRFGYPARARWLAPLAYLHPGRREEMDSAVMYLPAQSGAKLLDIGCGSGARLKLLRELGWRAEGIEIDPAAVKRCHEQGLPVRQGSLDEQRFPASTFDAVTMNHVIEHVAEPAPLLEEIRRVLVPAGKLVITTPNVGSWGHRRFKRGWVALDPPRHLRLFNRPTLRQLVERAGFDVQEVRTTIRGAAWVFLASHEIARHGRFSMMETTPRPARRWGRAMEFLEWMKSDPDAGEQITLIARRP